MPRLPIKRAVSAGGIVYRWNDGEIEVLICGQREPEIWGLPKGTPARGEQIEETARREVREETGVEGAIVESLNSIHYWFTRNGVRFSKTVYYFLMVPVGGDISLHDHEYDVVRWVSVREAAARLSYGNEVELVRKAAGMARKKDRR